MTNSETTFAETMAKWQAEREVANKAARNELLPQLRSLGITEVTAEYEGYGSPDETTVCAAPGDLLAHHSLTIYRTEANQTDRSRNALIAASFHPLGLISRCLQRKLACSRPDTPWLAAG